MHRTVVGDVIYNQGLKIYGANQKLDEKPERVMKFSGLEEHDGLCLHSYAYKVCGEMVFAPPPSWCDETIIAKARKVIDSNSDNVKRRKVM